MRHLIGLALIAIVPLPALAGDKKPAPDYSDFARLVHLMVVKQLPKQLEDASGWGQRVEIPPTLPFMKRRTIVRVGDKLEAPHGTWRKFVAKLEEPSKNLKIAVKEFKSINESSYRLHLDVDTTIMCQFEWRQWQKGLFLLGGDGVVDANFKAAIVCDVIVTPDFKKTPLELKTEPKIIELSIDLVDLKLRGGPLLPGEAGQAIAGEIKTIIRGAVKGAEPAVKDFADRAIAESIRTGKSAISAEELMKALPKR